MKSTPTNLYYIWKEENIKITLSIDSTFRGELMEHNEMKVIGHVQELVAIHHLGPLV